MNKIASVWTVWRWERPRRTVSPLVQSVIFWRICSSVIIIFSKKNFWRSKASNCTLHNNLIHYFLRFYFLDSFKLECFLQLETSNLQCTEERIFLFIYDSHFHRSFIMLDFLIIKLHTRFICFAHMGRCLVFKLI